mmetsp:Transcript_17019/g.48885  ORF Transcript_17019/g.48885 Transcript_17019/m.48885 type:complete len:280 (+) Transcript_17019:474-1313(+)
MNDETTCGGRDDCKWCGAISQCSDSGTSCCSKAANEGECNALVADKANCLWNSNTGKCKVMTCGERRGDRQLCLNDSQNPYDCQFCQSTNKCTGDDNSCCATSRSKRQCNVVSEEVCWWKKSKCRVATCQQRRDEQTCVRDELNPYQCQWCSGLGRCADADTNCCSRAGTNKKLCNRQDSCRWSSACDTCRPSVCAKWHGAGNNNACKEEGCRWNKNKKLCLEPECSSNTLKNDAAECERYWCEFRPKVEKNCDENSNCIITESFHCESSCTDIRDAGV